MNTFLLLNLPNNAKILQQWMNSYYSIGFGKTVPRHTFIFSFILPVGIHKIESKISIPYS